jgi:hypothetical protein
VKDVCVNPRGWGAMRRPGLTVRLRERCRHALAVLPLMYLALWASGCTSRSKELGALATAANVQSMNNRVAKGQPAPKCLVKLQLSFSDEGTAKPTTYAILSEEVCIKVEGKELALDRNIKLFIKPRHGWFPWDKWDEYGYCADESAKAGKDEISCRWNGQFRDTYPLTIRVWSEDAAQLERHVQMVDVFRNGALVFRSEVTKSELVIPGDRLEADGVPNLSEIDLRLYPAGVTLDPELVRTQVREGVDKFRRRFELTGAVALDKIPSDDLKKDAACLLQRIDAVRNELADLTDEPHPAPLLATLPKLGPPPPAGTPDTRPYAITSNQCPARGLSSLQKKYEEVKSRKSTEIERALNGFVNDLTRDLNFDAKLIRDGAAALLEKARLPGAGAGALETAEKLDSLSRETLGAIDDAKVVAGRARNDIVAFANSPKKQLDAYKTLVGELEKEGDFFEPYTPNPDRVDGELILPMKYSDAWQFYVLNPWNGGAIRLEDAGTEAGVSYVIPILDAAGLRIQFGDNRWTDVRLGLGMMVFEDRDAGAGEDDQEIRWAAQGNLGIANLRGGLAWVPAAARAPSADYFESHFRLLVGTDLYRIITGKNLEAGTVGEISP